VLLGAAAAPAKESEKMRAAIRTEKNEAVLVEWQNIIRPSPQKYLKTA
jgi:hypothetical protein